MGGGERLVAWSVALIILSYLAGSVPAGFMVVRAARGMDVRNYGSGNVGTINVLRAAGPGPALAVMAIDVAKGAVPVIVARWLGVPAAVVAICALVAIIGHNWSVFLGFNGGKGVATTLGSVAALDPVVVGLTVLIWLVVVAVSRYASLGSLLACCAVPFLMWWRGDGAMFIVFGALAAVLAILRHRANIIRLMRGKELKFNQRVKGNGA